MLDTSLISEYKSTANTNLIISGAASEIDNLIKKFESELEDMDTKLNLFTEAQAFMLTASEKSRRTITEHFEGYVTFILQYVLGSDYKFIVEWSTGTKTPSVDFIVETGYKDGGRLPADAEDSKGGGVKDVVGVALRIALLALLHNNNTIILDETFSQLSEKYKFNAATLLKELSSKFGFQFIFITHDNTFVENADAVFSVELANYESKVCKL